MANKLYKLVKETDEVDKNYIYNLYDLNMELEESLIPFVKNIEIDNSNNCFLGLYDYKNKTIRVNEKKLSTCESKKAKILALQIIRHELEHARQKMILEENKHSLYTKIIRYSDINYVLGNNINMKSDLGKFVMEKEVLKNYEDSYTIKPTERIADIKSWKFIVNLLKNQRTSEELLYSRIMLLRSYTRGYENNNFYFKPPTYEYLLKNGLIDEYDTLKKHLEKKYYNYVTRFTYGLPVSEKEYDKKILKTVKLKKKKTPAGNIEYIVKKPK